MKAFQFAAAGERLSVLCLGAHSDDIEIGVGATLLSMIGRGVRLDYVLSGVGAPNSTSGAGERLSEGMFSGRRV
jgi:LmbE family N-acetylglucosaminyl deacetylase